MQTTQSLLSEGMKKKTFSQGVNKLILITMEMNFKPWIEFDFRAEKLFMAWNSDIRK